MSAELINHSPDLKRLRDDGYNILIRAGHLLIRDVPYVNSKGVVARGTLVSVLSTAGDVTARPETHVAHFAGDHPCNKDGSIISGIQHSSGRKVLAEGVEIDHSFSAKPTSGYVDYYEKMTTYVSIISDPAASLDPTATAKTFPPIPIEDEDFPFVYVDTASSRAGIAALSQKLAIPKLGIIGLGGSGGYILDQVAKTPVKEIHIFDGDVLLSHSAFRAPAAASVDVLREQPMKVDYFVSLYAPMRRNIIPHPVFLDETNVELLAELDFAFVCAGDGNGKRAIVEALEEYGISFIDVGMSIESDGESLGGLVRVTTSTPGHREHVRAHNRIPFSDGGGGDEYE